MDNPNCPLCHVENCVFFFADQQRTYLSCPVCKLVFVPQRYWLPPDEEKAIYDLHENDAHDQGYRQFLSRLANPLLERLESEQNGLDFGCGPGPALPLLFAEQGHQVARFDPYYHNNPDVFANEYDFICATEVLEHLREPKKELTALFSMLKQRGWLGIMTKLVSDKQAFRHWHYIRDLTHICFYSRDTFEYIAQEFNAELFFLAKDVILLKKK